MRDLSCFDGTEKTQKNFTVSNLKTTISKLHYFSKNHLPRNMTAIILPKSHCHNGLGGIVKEN
jgi:hypothetical protein